MSEIKTRSFGHTAAALIVFDSTVAQRARVWKTAETASAVNAAERADIEALRLVQEAFYRDTSDINGRESCLRVDLASLRKLAKGSTLVSVSETNTAAHEGDARELDDVDEVDAEGDANAPGPR